MSRLFLNQNFMFFPMVHLFLLYNIMYPAGKRKQLFTETVLAFNLRFQHRTQLAGKPSTPFERAYNLGLEISLSLYVYLVIFPLPWRPLAHLETKLRI